MTKTHAWRWGWSKEWSWVFGLWSLNFVFRSLSFELCTWFAFQHRAKRAKVQSSKYKDLRPKAKGPRPNLNETQAKDIHHQRRGGSVWHPSADAASLRTRGTAKAIAVRRQYTSLHGPRSGAVGIDSR